MGRSKNRKKKTEGLTQVVREVRREDSGSSGEESDKFVPSLGRSINTDNVCAEPRCFRQATHIVVTEDPEDEEDPESEYEACGKHARMKTFRNQKVLRDYIKESQNNPETEEDNLEQGKSDSKLNILSTPARYKCEVADCKNEAAYNSKAVEGKSILTCFEHTHDEAVKSKLVDADYVATDDASVYSLSSISASDFTDHTIRQTYLKARQIGPKTAAKEERKARRTSKPYDPIPDDKTYAQVIVEPYFSSPPACTTKILSGEAGVSQLPISGVSQDSADQDMDTQTTRIEIADSETTESENEKSETTEMETEYPEKPLYYYLKGSNLPLLPEDPDDTNTVAVFVGRYIVPLSFEWTPKKMVRALNEQIEDGTKFHYFETSNTLVNGKTLPYNKTIGTLHKEGLVKEFDLLTPRTKEKSPERMDYDLQDKDISSSIHNPKKTTFSSDEPNPNKEHPMKKIVKEAETNAFLNKKSYADTAGNKKVTISTSSWINKTQCAISPELKTGRRVPNTDMVNVAFWDLATIDVTQAELWEAIREVNPAGMSYRENAQWLELGFKTIDERDKHLATQITMPRGQLIQPLPPRKYSPQQVYVRFANVPILDEKEIRKCISLYWGKWGVVGRIEPHYYRDSKILSRRWDMILTVQASRILDAPVIFEMYGVRVCSQWEGSMPSCTNCKSAGHWTKNCSPAFRKEAEKRDRDPPAPPIEQGKQQKKNRKEEEDSEERKKKKIEALPKPEIPKPNSADDQEVEKVKEAIAKTYEESGHAAKGVNVRDDSNDGFTVVENKKKAQNKKGNGENATPSQTQNKNRSITPPPKQRDEKRKSGERTPQRERTPRRRKPSKFAKTLDLNTLQSNVPTGKRNRWNGWQVAYYFYKTQDWLTWENLNYFAAYPGAAKYWMDRLPNDVYDNAGKWLKNQKDKGTLLRTPLTTSICGDIVATPHQSLKMENMPPSLPLRTEGKEKDTLQEDPSIIVPAAIEEQKWEILRSHAMDVKKEYTTIILQGDTTAGIKVSEFNIGNQELSSELRDRIESYVGLEIVLEKDHLPLSQGYVTGSANQIGIQDTITIKAYKKQPTKEELLGHQLPLTIYVGTNTITEYVRYREQIGEIKQRIAAKINMNPSDFQLRRHNYPLEEESTVKEHELSSASRIKVFKTTYITVTEDPVAESSTSHKKNP
jgi:hypothetical protein